MSDTYGDLAGVKAQQREQWSRVAQGWRTRWAALERGAQPLSERMMEMAHITTSQRILDVATGIGEPALTAARRVGPNGSVVAIDQAPQMVAMARERLQEAGIAHVEVVEGDAETMPLPLAAFDAVVSRWGIMLFDDPIGTLTRLRSALVPGGWLAAAIWGPPEQVPIISLSFSALSRLPMQSPPQFSGPNPFALSDPRKLEQVLHDVGLTQVQSESFTVTFEFASVDDLRDYLREVSAPLRMIVATASQEDQATIWRNLGEAAGAFRGEDGVIRLANTCLIAAGQR